MQTVNFEEVLEKILRKDARFHREAYNFVREALDYTQKASSKPTRDQIRHVNGRELLEGIRAYGLSQFGPMTMSVLHEWGVQRCEDFGEIVFNLVDQSFLRKTDADSRADFQGGYDFFEAFRKPFLPATKTQPPMPEAKTS